MNEKTNKIKTLIDQINKINEMLPKISQEIKKYRKLLGDLNAKR